MTPAPEIVLIAACANDGVIGKANQLPWRLPEDLAHLKKLTTGHSIIMGRKTFESIGRALPNRRSIVITRQSAQTLGDASPAISFDGVERCASLEQALALSQQTHPNYPLIPKSPIFILGGAQIYAQAISLASRIELTEIDITVEGGDAFFPKLNAESWLTAPFDANAPTKKTSALGLVYQFLTLLRK